MVTFRMVGNMIRIGCVTHNDGIALPELALSGFSCSVV